MMPLPHVQHSGRFWLLIALLLVAAIYWRGLSGGWFFDDYPNIVDNHALQITNLHVRSLIDAAFSSNASAFRRPLASLSFALNYRLAGLDPYWMKLTNLLIHLVNGVLVFVLTRMLLRSSVPLKSSAPVVGAASAANALPSLALNGADTKSIASKAAPTSAPTAVGISSQGDIVAVLVTAAWMLLPINLTGVLYVVQRMESLANVFVLIGLMGYMAGRRRMLAGADAGGLALCVASLVITTGLGLLAKETAVMLPLYALLVEWMLFRGMRTDRGVPTGRRDWRIAALFLTVLVLPMLVGVGWVLRGIWHPAAWAARDFTMRTRLLSEARIVLDYVHWTLLPSPRALSFYHDNFVISSGWLSPWTTLASVLGLVGLVGLIAWSRRRAPLVALGLALFLGSHLLTGTILPLELIYEHRNYFASFGLMLALVPLLAAPGVRHGDGTAAATGTDVGLVALPYVVQRRFALGLLLIFWASQTALTAHAWGSPLRLTQMLAAVAPDSPRAQYDLGRSYSVYSNYDPASPFTPLALTALEHAATIPGSSILPEQALIFMSARMHLPAKEQWWNSLIAKLEGRPPTAEDQTALRTLSICAIKHQCDLPKDRMVAAFVAALSHPNPGAQLQARYGEYAWNVLDDKALSERMLAGAVQGDPNQADYRGLWVRALAAQGRLTEAAVQLQVLESQNTGGRLDDMLHELRALPGISTPATPAKP